MPGIVYDAQGNPMYDTGAGLVPLTPGFMGAGNMDMAQLAAQANAQGAASAPPYETPEEQLRRLNPDLYALQGAYAPSPPQPVALNWPLPRPTLSPAPPFAADIPGLGGQAEPNVFAGPLAVPGAPPGGPPSLAPINPYQVDVRERVETSRGGPVAPAGVDAYGQNVIAIGEEAKDIAAREGALLAEQARIKAEGDLAVSQRTIDDLDVQQDAAREAATTAALRIEQIRTELQALRAQKIDPWADVSDGQKAAGFIAAAIAGFLNPTGPNSAIEALSGMLERNIRTQQANFTNEKERLGAEQSLAREERFAAQDALETQSRIAVATWEGIRQEAEAQAAQLNDPILREKYAAFINGVDEKINETLNRHEVADREFEFEKTIRERQVRVSESQNALDWKKYKDLKAVAEAQATEIGIDPAKAIFSGKDGRILGVVSGERRQEELDKIRTDVGQATHIWTQVGELITEQKRLGEKYGGPLKKFVDSPDVKALRARHKALLFDFVRFSSGLSYTDKQLESMTDVVPVIDSILVASPVQTWAQFSNMAAQRLSARTNASGVMGVDGKPVDWTAEAKGLRPPVLSEIQLTGAAPPVKATVPRGSEAYTYQIAVPSMRNALVDLYGDNAPALSDRDLWRASQRMLKGSGGSYSLLLGPIAGIRFDEDTEEIRKRFNFFLRGAQGQK